MKHWLATLRKLSQKMKSLALTVYCIARHRKTPFLPKLLALLVASYAFSPIDLIPDFIPIIGYLDDMILLPLGILLIIRLTPEEVVDEASILANDMVDKPISRAGGLTIILVWLVAALWLIQWVKGMLQ